MHIYFLGRCLCLRTLSQHCSLRIPETVIRLMNQVGTIYVGTCSKSGIPNISERKVFLVEETSLVWGSWFERKTLWNIQENNHVTVAVIDITTLASNHAGYQMKGHVELVSDPDKIVEFMRMVMTQPRYADFKKIIQSQQRNPPLIVRFKPEELYLFGIAESARGDKPISQAKNNPC